MPIDDHSSFTSLRVYSRDLMIDFVANKNILEYEITFVHHQKVSSTIGASKKQLVISIWLSVFIKFPCFFLAPKYVDPILLH